MWDSNWIGPHSPGPWLQIFAKRLLRYKSSNSFDFIHPSSRGFRISSFLPRLFPVYLISDNVRGKGLIHLANSTAEESESSSIVLARLSGRRSSTYQRCRVDFWAQGIGVRIHCDGVKGYLRRRVRRDLEGLVRKWSTHCLIDNESDWSSDQVMLRYQLQVSDTFPSRYTSKNILKQ